MGAGGRGFESLHSDNASIAQLVEQLICSEKVVGSIPTASSNLNLNLIGGSMPKSDDEIRKEWGYEGKPKQWQ